MLIRIFHSTLFLLVSLKGLTYQQDTIPVNLLECYNGSVSLMPMTINNFIEIIRKIESSQLPFMDMNMIVNSLLHNYWRDGIELDRNIIVAEPEVIPFRTTGFESYKYELIIHRIVPKITRLFSDDHLSTSEKCTLHHMLSGSVDIWERGDEYTVCKIYHGNDVTNFGSTGYRKSSCPIANGVLSTKIYGTVSPRNILLAISTQLEPVNIPLSYLIEGEEESHQNMFISNKWIALSGDLAETIIIQTPLMNSMFKFGPGGQWNDTDMPTEYYMTLSKEALQKKLWQYTDAEILATLDGLIMAEEVERWTGQDHILRLSQLFEAYYSTISKFYSIQAHACSRRTFFEKLIAQKKEIIQQVQTFAEVLYQRMPNYLNNTIVINTKVEELVNQFNEYTKNLLWKPIQCPEEVNIKPKIKLNIVIDNSWTSYEKIKFLTALGDSIDVSAYGSQMTVITKDNGRITIDSKDTLGEVYLNWNNSDYDGVTSLTESLLVIKNDLVNKRKDFSDDLSESFSYLTVILSISTILGNEEISDSITLLNSIREVNPDMSFIYICSSAHAPMFVKLTSALDSQTDRIITADRNSQAIIEELSLLIHYPRAIKPPLCENLTQENRIVNINGFANQGTILLYRIHPYYLCRVNALLIQVENHEKGNLVTCIARDQQTNFKQCKEVSLGEKAGFNIKNPCISGIIYEKYGTWNENCKPIFIEISGKRSLSTCTGLECRMPDDIPFELVVHGLNCVEKYSPRCNGSEHKRLTTILLLICVLSVLHKNIKFS